MTLCILHLGAEKTGTSSIQKYLGVHREALLGEGLLYPENFTNPSGHVHLKLSGAAVDGSLDPANPQGVAFRAELDGALKRGAKTAKNLRKGESILGDLPLPEVESPKESTQPSQKGNAVEEAVPANHAHSVAKAKDHATKQTAPASAPNGARDWALFEPSGEK